ncbi:conserved hypothetical protein [Flavobacterium sp. 9AF]|uniref:restriction endonuclease subunit S n=1 Tax=Flavobacterium sp. 9AF TaxID=2653142 RepID=UPI0012F11729|nr:restriction endonuclease subunit S [Flavobacterium sp. 9AF]VXB18567.1 conserved hypothetical protein [Flavobacterium sp. 9AF]
MNLDIKSVKWKEFLISEIFDITGTVTTHPSLLKKGGTTPRITCAATNNGFDNTYKNAPTEKGGVITIDSATVGYVSYQPYDFIATDHVEKITLKNQKIINKYLGAFLVGAISSATLNKYGYGYKFSQTRIAKQKILLPVNVKKEPDFEFMEFFIKQKEQEKFQEYQNYLKRKLKELKGYKEVPSIDKKEWAEFYLKEIFNEIQRGKRLKKADHKKGKIPYVSSTGLNNGVDGYVGNKEKVRVFSNCLTIANSGSVGACFYQPFEFVASDHVTQLKNDAFSPYTYKFISSIIKRLGVKYSFNREMNDTRIKKEKIMLPTNKLGEPDYEYMENYIKHLEYIKLKEYLNFK